MQKVGVLTFHHSLNYGAVLQAYALFQTLVSLGHQPELIDYIDPNHGLHTKGALKRFQRSLEKRVLDFTMRRTRKKRTRHFLNSHLEFSEHTYRDPCQLEKCPPEYDHYIVGSDQVWNPHIVGSDSSHFLDFAPTGKTRISYAASFGLDALPPGYMDQYATWINRLDYISVREQQGLEIVRQLTGRNAELVLDPTLLIDDAQWAGLAESAAPSEPYILCYYILDDCVMNDKIQSIARSISKRTGWSVVSIGKRAFISDRGLLKAGPAELLTLFHYASFVLTTSFHGTAFAINFRKPFYTPLNYSLIGNLAVLSRITSLAELLGVQDRLLDASQPLPKHLDIDMDFDSAHELLKEERKSSIRFLERALNSK